MPQYTVPIQGGGSVTVNASDPQAAIDNVVAGGNTPSGGTGSVIAGGHMQGGPGHPNPGPGTPTGNGDPTTGDKGFNQAAADLAMRLADNAAQRAYLNAKLALDTEELAFRKAQAAWQQTFDQAQADRSWAAQQAELTGVFNGEPTLAAQLQQANLSGIYNGAPTLAAQLQQANITGYDAQGRPTFARQTEENRVAQAFLALQAGLRGPNDPFQYLRTLSGTPNGIADIVNSAWGRYNMGGNPSGEMANVATVAGQIANLNAAQGGNMPVAAAASGDMRYVPPQGSAPGVPGSFEAPASLTGRFRPAGVATGGPVNRAIAEGAGGVPAAAMGTVPGSAYDRFLASIPRLPQAGQIAPQQYNKMLPSQQAALWAGYEAGLGPSGAMRPEDAQAAYLRSLPKYSYGGTGTVRI